MAKPNSTEVFEAISHPLRMKILKVLAKSPMGFSELKKTLRIESSGELSFHLNKMRSLLDKDSEGRYALNKTGYTALETVRSLEKCGWYTRAFYFNLVVFTLSNIWAYLSFSFSTNFLIVLALSSLWIVFLLLLDNSSQKSLFKVWSGEGKKSASSKSSGGTVLEAFHIV
ncbi:MAG: helix-turn-helix transcriptional regulator [Candidatus Brockarchaeota archaeon]|nr:helix-turn-helix transcriptional regulator [Candidatus Brockarchaeota archaeon]